MSNCRGKSAYGGRQSSNLGLQNTQVIDHHLLVSHCSVWFLGANLVVPDYRDMFVQSAQKGHLVSKIEHLIKSPVILILEESVTAVVVSALKPFMCFKPLIQWKRCHLERRAGRHSSVQSTRCFLLWQYVISLISAPSPSV